MIRAVMTSFIDEDTEVHVFVHFYPGHPAKISGPPENCYEAEPDEMELVSVRGVSGDELVLTKEQEAQLYERVYSRREEFLA